MSGVPLYRRGCGRRMFYLVRRPSTEGELNQVCQVCIQRYPTNKKTHSPRTLP